MAKTDQILISVWKNLVDGFHPNVRILAVFCSFDQYFAMTLFCGYELLSTSKKLWKPENFSPSTIMIQSLYDQCTIVVQIFAATYFHGNLFSWTTRVNFVGIYFPNGSYVLFLFWRILYYILHGFEKSAILRGFIFANGWKTQENLYLELKYMLFLTESPGKSITGQPCSLRKSELSSDADEDSATTFTHHHVIQPEHRAPHSCLSALISHATTTTTTWYVSVIFFILHIFHFVRRSGLLFVFGCLFIWFVCLFYAFLLDLPTRGGWSYDGASCALVSTGSCGVALC